MLGPRSFQGVGMPGPKSLPEVGGYTRGRKWVYVEGTPLPEGDHRSERYASYRNVFLF